MAALPEVPSQLQGWMDDFYHSTLQPKLLFSTCLAYLVIIKSWEYYNLKKEPIELRRSLRNSLTKFKVNGASKSAIKSLSLFDWFVFGHNVVLMVFSAVIFGWVAWLMHVERVQRQGGSFLGLMQSKGHEMNAQGLLLAGWLFYLSKYYEFLDTFILLAKGKPSNFLQTYHHVATVVIMWGLVVFSNPALWLITVFNSGIHTLMYTYYALTSIGKAPGWKQLMTWLQIAQFFTGNIIGTVMIYYKNYLDQHSPKSYVDLYGWGVVSKQTGVLASSVATIAFACTLIFLFLDFARRTYAKSHPAKLKTH